LILPPAYVLYDRNPAGNNPRRVNCGSISNQQNEQKDLDQFRLPNTAPATAEEHNVQLALRINKIEFGFSRTKAKRHAAACRSIGPIANC
jgi:hypothetical protein